MPASRSLASEITPLIGIPWQAGASGPEAYDCWAAVGMVEARLFGRTIPGLTPERRRGIAHARQSWARSDQPRDGDIVEMRRMGRANHVGVWIEGRVLHCQQGAGMVYDRPSDIRLMGWTMRFWTPVAARARRRAGASVRALYVPGLDLLMEDGAAPADLISGHRAVPVAARAGETIAEVVARAGLGGEPLAAFLRPRAAKADLRLPEDVTDESLAAFLRDLGAVPVEAWGTTRIAADHTLVLTALPQGGGGSNPLRIILSIAVMAAAFFVAGPLGLGAQLGSALGIEAAAGTTLAFGAVSALGQFVVSTLLPPPSPRGVSSFNEDISPTFSASAQSSIARPGAPVPVQFGRHIHLLDDVAPPFARFENNNQVICQLLALGMGEHVLEEVRLGDTTVWRDGGLTDTLPGVAIEHVPSGSSVTLFEEAVWSQGDVTGLTLEPDSVVGWHAAVPRGKQAEAVEVDIVFQQLVVIDNSGNNQDRTVTIRVEAQMVDDDDTALGEVIELQTLGFTAATRSALRSSHKWFVPLGRWRLRLTRLTPAGDDQTFDTAIWTGLKGILPGGRIVTGMELLAVRVEVGEQFAAQSARQVQAVKTRKLPLWNGFGWTEPEPTREIAWAVAEIARAHGRLGDLDMAELLDLHAVWSSRGDRFDTVFDQSLSFWEALSAALRVGRAQADQIGRRIRLWRDAPQPVPRQLFSERNILRGSLVVRPRLPVSDRPERLVAQYMDARTWRPAELAVGAITGRERRERYFGITDKEHLLREVGHDWRAARFRTVEVEFEVEMENRLILRGDVIAVSHFELTDGIALGLDGWSGLEIGLDREIDLGGQPSEMLMILSAPEGSVIGPFRVVRPPQADRTATLSIEQGEFDRILADYGTDPRDWAARSAVRDEPVRVVLGRGADMTLQLIVQSVTQERQGRARVICMDDDARAHDLPVAEAGTLDDIIIGITLADFPAPGGRELQVRVDVRGGIKSPGVIYEFTIDGIIWQPLGQGGPNFSAPLPAGMTRLRAAVVVGGARGPWVEAALADEGIGSPDPLVEVVAGQYQAEARLHVAGTAVAGAVSYRFELRGAGDALLAIQFRSMPEIDLSRAGILALGALTRDMVLRVAAVDANATPGPFAQIDLSFAAPEAVTGLVQQSSGLHVWDVPATPPPFGWRVRWQQRSGGGVTGSVDVSSPEWDRAAAGWPQNVWVAGLDGIGIGPEAFRDYSPPPPDPSDRGP